MHRHVTGFSAATIFVFAIASPLRAQGIEVFGGYSRGVLRTGQLHCRDCLRHRPDVLSPLASAFTSGR